jgi:hypothetical protein
MTCESVVDDDVEFGGVSDDFAFRAGAANVADHDLDSVVLMQLAFEFTSQPTIAVALGSILPTPRAIRRSTRRFQTRTGRSRRLAKAAS